MRLHIVTASKGGTGKTSFSATLSAYNLNKPEGNSVLLVDANTNNIDFFSITSRVHFDELTNEDDNPHVSTYGDYYIMPLKQHTSRGFCMVRKYPYDLFDGVEELYAMILKAKEFSVKNDIDTIIVDTNICLENLMPTYLFRSSNETRMSNLKGNIEKLFEKTQNQFDVTIWYMWCLNDFLKVKKPTNVRTIQNVINNFKTATNDRFDEEKHLVHIINNYNRQKAPNWFIRKLLEQEVDDIETEQENVVNGFNFTTVAKILKRISTTLNDEDVDKDEYKNKQFYVDEYNLFTLKNSTSPHNRHFIANELYDYYFKVVGDSSNNNDFYERAKDTKTMFLYNDIAKKLEGMGL